MKKAPLVIIASLLLAHTISSPAWSARAVCNLDARILDSNGNGAQSTAQAIAVNNENFNGQTCTGYAESILTKPNGKKIVKVKASINNGKCSILITGQQQGRKVQRIRNGNCFIEDRGRQVRVGNQTYSISSFVERERQSR